MSKAFDNWLSTLQATNNSPLLIEHRYSRSSVIADATSPWFRRWVMDTSKGMQASERDVSLRAFTETLNVPQAPAMLELVEKLALLEVGDTATSIKLSFFVPTEKGNMHHHLEIKRQSNNQHFRFPPSTHLLINFWIQRLATTTYYPPQQLGEPTLAPKLPLLQPSALHKFSSEEQEYIKESVRSMSDMLWTKDRCLPKFKEQWIELDREELLNATTTPNKTGKPKVM